MAHYAIGYVSKGAGPQDYRITRYDYRGGSSRVHEEFVVIPAAEWNALDGVMKVLMGAQSMGAITESEYQAAWQLILGERYARIVADHDANEEGAA